MLFGFSISQEDPLTELKVLELKSGDRVLSVASGGEVPLSLMSLVPGIAVCAADISEEQIRLCRMKLLAARCLPFPENGEFLGYAQMNKMQRTNIYREKLRPQMSEEDVQFWEQHPEVISRGVINAGRFEIFIHKLRLVVDLLLGRKNIIKLIRSKTLEEQQDVFNQYLATRKSLHVIFKLAFHPRIYKNRGLQEQALIHADNSTGERFYNKFQQFCTVGKASENYFLSYFLHGSCLDSTSFPPYLLPQNKTCLMENSARFELKQASFQEVLQENSTGSFNKIHLSNLGDWMNKTEFHELMELISEVCLPGTRICSRHLHKNHFNDGNFERLQIDKKISSEAELLDRFPFYSITGISLINDSIISAASSL
jgi:S-adenosylmethionine:diacylglycerol 3-amino-3-carboxypropyl transferase